MAHYSKIFSKVPVEVQNKSGFDMSHENLFTAKVGTLIPILTEEILPNDTISLGSMLNVQLPPMATDFFGSVDVKLEAFFVPNRLLLGGWQSFMTHPTASYVSSETSDVNLCRFLPRFNLTKFNIGPGTLSDYLGLRLDGSLFTAQDVFQVRNPLPFLAYHKIWEDWYRDSRIQKPAFCRVPQAFSSDITRFAKYAPYVIHNGDSPRIINDTMLYDNHDLTILRQRNWSRDYYTNATPQPQAGPASSLSFEVSGGSGQFTISALRAANSLQKWMERNNLAGYRYSDQIKAQFGIYPADSVMDRAIYLGSNTINVYTKSVYQSAQAGSSSNPFTSVGSRYGSSQAIGDCSLVDNWTASEHGIFMVMFSLVPRAFYGTGSRKYIDRSTVGDFAFPALAGVGDQEIKMFELVSNPLENDSRDFYKTFGYTQRYSEYKYHEDEVHGLLRDGQSLSSFALKRSFDVPSHVELGSSFLQIPTSFMDDVTAVKSELSNFGAWCDAYFVFKMLRALPAYSIPTLGDEKDTHTEIIDNGGKRL